MDAETYHPCVLCARRGVLSYRGWVQIDFNEALYSCPDNECPYPFGFKGFKILTKPRLLREMQADLKKYRAFCKMKKVNSSAILARLNKLINERESPRIHSPSQLVKASTPSQPLTGFAETFRPLLNNSSHVNGLNRSFPSLNGVAAVNSPQTNGASNNLPKFNCQALAGLTNGKTVIDSPFRTKSPTLKMDCIPDYLSFNGSLPTYDHLDLSSSTNSVPTPKSAPVISSDSCFPTLNSPKTDSQKDTKHSQGTDNNPPMDEFGCGLSFNDTDMFSTNSPFLSSPKPTRISMPDMLAMTSNEQVKTQLSTNGLNPQPMGMTTLTSSAGQANTGNQMPNNLHTTPNDKSKLATNGYKEQPIYSSMPTPAGVPSKLVTNGLNQQPKSSTMFAPSIVPPKTETLVQNAETKNGLKAPPPKKAGRAVLNSDRVLGKAAAIAARRRSAPGVIDAISPTETTIQEKNLDAVTHSLKALNYMQWKNKEALCWLDSAMNLLVHSRLFHMIIAPRPKQSCPILKQLLENFTKAQALLKQALELKRFQLLGQKQTIVLETGVGMVAVKTGGGDGTDIFKSPPLNSTDATERLVVHTSLSPRLIPTQQVTNSKDSNSKSMMVTTQQLQDRSNQLTETATELLNAAREKVWKHLSSKLGCEKGVNDSPVFALPQLLGEDPVVKEQLTHTFQWSMTCSQCGFRKLDSVSKQVITFPKVPADFTMRAPYFKRPCFKCQAPNQRVSMSQVEQNTGSSTTLRYPSILLAHFTEGVHKEPALYDFYLGGQYSVTGMVQYKHHPDHFVTWIRHPLLNLWMELDDLKHPLVRYSDTPPSFPSSQVHMLMWTRKNQNVSSLPLCMSPRKGGKPIKPAPQSKGRKTSISPSVIRTLPPTMPTAISSSSLSTLPLNGATMKKPRGRGKKNTAQVPTVAPQFPTPLRSSLRSPPQIAVRKSELLTSPAMMNQFPSYMSQRPSIPATSTPVGPNTMKIGGIGKIKSKKLDKMSADQIAKLILKGGKKAAADRQFADKNRMVPVFEGYVAKSLPKDTKNSTKKQDKQQKSPKKGKSVCFKSRTPTPEPYFANIQRFGKRKSDSELTPKTATKRSRFDVRSPPPPPSQESSTSTMTFQEPVLDNGLLNGMVNNGYNGMDNAVGNGYNAADNSVNGGNGPTQTDILAELGLIFPDETCSQTSTVSSTDNNTEFLSMPCLDAPADNGDGGFATNVDFKEFFPDANLSGATSSNTSSANTTQDDMSSTSVNNGFAGLDFNSMFQ